MKPAIALKPNEMNIINLVESGIKPDQVGTAKFGPKKLIVDQLRIDLFYVSECNRTRQLICAHAIAHEMGHVFLGSAVIAHRTGSATNIMTSGISFVLPRLRTNIMLPFDSGQGVKIRKRLGF